jgi:nicotinamide-nucleotide amidase
MKAELITIGDEILVGQIVDTNSAWMAQQLNLIGIEVYRITSVHDDHGHILKALAEAGMNADLVLITGGLGPTKDDITKKALCEYFKTELKFYPDVFEHVRRLLTAGHVEVNQYNRDQAMLPASCTVLHNSIGTAAGMWFEHNHTIFVSMPGVPFEMEAIMAEQVLPRLRERGIGTSIVHKTVLTIGLPESMLAGKIAAWENALPNFIKLAYLPNPMMVRLRLSGYGSDQSLLEREIEKQIKELLTLIPENVFGFDNDNLALAVGRNLVAGGKTLAVAESCTGGFMAHSITSNPGASAYFNGGVVAYSNDIKSRILGVPDRLLEQPGAVSREVAEAMAVGVRTLFHVDYAVATTGIAGPDGGSEQKPVGTVWIAVAGPSGITSQKYIFSYNRERNIIRSTQTALNMLRMRVLADRSDLT